MHLQSLSSFSFLPSSFFSFLFSSLNIFLYIFPLFVFDPSLTNFFFFFSFCSLPYPLTSPFLILNPLSLLSSSHILPIYLSIAPFPFNFYHFASFPSIPFLSIYLFYLFLSLIFSFPLFYPLPLSCAFFSF